VWAVAETAMPVGDTVTVVLRPEKIGLALTPPPDARNCFAGRLRKVAYLGSVAHCYLELGGHRSVVAFQQDARSALAHAHVQHDVFAYWPAESASILHGDRRR
jgi:hypothetical protein